MINLKQHRKRAGLTQKHMARALGLSQVRTVSKWENNPGCMTLDRLEQYASACGVTVADLMGFDGEAQEKLSKIREALLGPPIDILVTDKFTAKWYETGDEIRGRLGDSIKEQGVDVTDCQPASIPDPVEKG